MAQIILTNGAAAATPAAGAISVYSKTADKRLYYKDDTGVEQGPLGSAGSVTDKARGFMTAAFTTGTGPVKVPIDTVSFDTNGLVDLTNTRITPKKAGYYSISYRASVTGTAAGQRAFPMCYKNGAEVARGVDSTISTVSPIGAGGSDIQYFNGTTDYAELWIYTSTPLALESFSYTSFLSLVGPL